MEFQLSYNPSRNKSIYALITLKNGCIFAVHIAG